MLVKKHKIAKKKDFENIFRKGRSFKEGFLILKVNSNPFPTSRFAFVVSQKVSKKAVVRNKIRRRLKELIRVKTSKIKKGKDFVFIALPGLEKQKPLETEENLVSLLEKVGGLSK